MCHWVLKAVEKYTWNKQEQKRPQEKPTNSHPWQVYWLLPSTALPSPPICMVAEVGTEHEQKGTSSGHMGHKALVLHGLLWGVLCPKDSQLFSNRKSALPPLLSQDTLVSVKFSWYLFPGYLRIQGQDCVTDPVFSRHSRLLRAVILKFAQPAGMWRTIFEEWEGSIRTSFMLSSNPKISKKSSLIIL